MPSKEEWERRMDANPMPDSLKTELAEDYYRLKDREAQRSIDKAKYDNLAAAFRTLRQAWFFANIYENAPPGVWESMDTEAERSATNIANLQAFKLLTERIINGESLPAAPEHIEDEDE